ncbi:MAG: hypothetical protein ACN6OQ_05635, partial [Paraburkholderia nemoris]
LPLTTRKTVLNLDSSDEEVACDAVDMTFSDKPVATQTGGAQAVETIHRVRQADAAGNSIIRTRRGRCIFILNTFVRYQGKRCEIPGTRNT